MTRNLLKLLTAFALSGVAAISMASDSGFIVDELRAVHSELTDTRRWVDSDIRANLSHRWESAPRRLADSGLRFAESELEGLPWVTEVDLHRIIRNGNFLAGFGVSGVGLLWTGESHALGFQPSGEWIDGSGDDFASFGVFGRKAVGDWGVLGANVFGDYASDSEFGEFSRWSLGADFQSELADLRGNWYAEGTGFRSRRIQDGEIFAYSPSGIDAELNLRWRGVSEWTGFAEYEKWDGRFGKVDTQDVGFGVTYRPLGGGLLAGLEVDAGYFNAAGADDRLDLRLAYSRTLGGDNRAQGRDFGFGIQSALVAPVKRERKIKIAEATIMDPELVRAEERILRQRDGLWIGDNRPFMLNVNSRCTLVFDYPRTPYEQEISVELHAQAENPAQFDDLCDTINKTANIRTTDSGGNLATHRAVSGGALDNLKILIAAGVRITATNTAGKTPLDLAQAKHSATTDSELRGTLSTIAMVIRASGGECVAENGTLCTIAYDALYGDEGNFDFFIIDDVALRSDFPGGEIYQLHHPEYGNMTLHSTYPWQWDARITVTPGGSVRVKDGVILKTGYFYLQQIYASNDNFPYPAHVQLKIDISVVSHPQPWTIPPIRKVAPGYTGTYFTVTATPPNAHLGYSFGPGEQSAYRIAAGGKASDILVYDPHNARFYASHLFVDDFEAYGSFAHWFSRDIEAGEWWRSTANITTADQRLAATYQNGALAVTLNQAVGQNKAQVHAIHMFVDPYGYKRELQTLNFTIAIPSIPSLAVYTVGASHVGVVATLTDDGLRNVNYEVTGNDPQLTINQVGHLRVGTAISIGDSAAVTAKIISPDLLGTLTITARVHSRCFSGNSRRIAYNSDHRSNYAIQGGKLNRAAADNNLAEVCRLISIGADPNYPRDSISNRPLNSGALNGDKRIAQALVLHGARVNYTFGNSRFTPLHFAARGVNVEYGRVLLKNGADPRRKTTGNNQPIHEMGGNITKTKDDYVTFFTLLTTNRFNPAHIDAKGQGGWTALMRAAIANNERQVDALLELHARTDIVNDQGRTVCGLNGINSTIRSKLECS